METNTQHTALGIDPYWAEVDRHSDYYAVWANAAGTATITLSCGEYRVDVLGADGCFADAGWHSTEAEALAAAEPATIVSAVAGPVWSARSMLSRALELVQAGWCQHEQACSGAGRCGLQPDDPNATAWSLDGAVDLAYTEAADMAWGTFEATVLVNVAHARQCLAERERLVDALETAIAVAEREGTQRSVFLDQPTVNTELSYWNDVDGRTQEDVIGLCQTVLAELGAS